MSEPQDNELCSKKFITVELNGHITSRRVKLLFYSEYSNYTVTLPITHARHVKVNIKSFLAIWIYSD